MHGKGVYLCTVRQYLVFYFFQVPQYILQGAGFGNIWENRIMEREEQMTETIPTTWLTGTRWWHIGGAWMGASLVVSRGSDELLPRKMK